MSLQTIQFHDCPVHLLRQLKDVMKKVKLPYGCVYTISSEKYIDEPQSTPPPIKKLKK